MKERIKILRKNLGLTLEEFGRKLGVTKTTISRIENGVNSVTEQMLTSICHTYNVNEDWLRTGDGEMFLNIDPDDYLMEWAGRVLGGEPEHFQRRFLAALSTLDESDWKTLEKLFSVISAK